MARCSDQVLSRPSGDDDTRQAMYSPGVLNLGYFGDGLNRASAASWSLVNDNAGESGLLNVRIRTTWPFDYQPLLSIKPPTTINRRLPPTVRSQSTLAGCFDPRLAVVATTQASAT